jgi:hypothetical protein
MVSGQDTSHCLCSSSHILLAQALSILKIAEIGWERRGGEGEKRGFKASSEMGHNEGFQDIPSKS